MVKARVAIIGGGYSGMAAAVRIAEHGGVPVVFEAARILGGRARRVEYRDITVDNGQHILSGAYIELLRLMDVVGVGARALNRVPLTLVMPPHFAMRAPPLPAPLHTAFALLTAKGLRWSDRFAAIRMMQWLKGANWSVDAAWTVRTLLTTQSQPQRLVDYLWKPLTVSALNTPIETASAQVLANVLRDVLSATREASDLLIPTVDLSALFPEPAAAWIEQSGGTVRLGTRVTGIRGDREGVTIDFGIEPEVFDAAIVAIAPQQLSAFSGIFASNTAPVIEFEPITTVYLVYDAPRTTRLEPTMLGQAHGTVQWFFDRRALSDRPNDRLLIAAVISASGAHQALENDALVRVAHLELLRHLPDLGAPVLQKVVNEKYASFACTPQVVRPTAITAHPNIFLAGDFVDNPYPATLEGAVRNGVAAANIASRYCSTRTSYAAAA